MAKSAQNADHHHGEEFWRWETNGMVLGENGTSYQTGGLSDSQGWLKQNAETGHVEDGVKHHHAFNK